MAYDTATGQLILFGGGLTTTTVTYSTTWTWNGTNWTKLTPTTSPPSRSGASMAYDKATHQLILFGGADVGTAKTSTTWEWNGTNWSQLTPATSPTARSWASMAYDTATGQLILFSGLGGHTGLSRAFYPTTWVWNGTNWAKLTPTTSPTARFIASMAYDPASGQLILDGGYNGGFLRTTIWNWNGTNWTKLTPKTIPTIGVSSSMAYDPGISQLVLEGGNTGKFSTWAWDGTDWTKLDMTTSSSVTQAGSMADDPGTGQVVLFGGSNIATGELSTTWVLVPNEVQLTPSVSVTAPTLTYGAETTAKFTVSVNGTSGHGYPEGTVTLETGSTSEPVSCSPSGTTATPTATFNCHLTSADELSAGSHPAITATFSPGTPSSSSSGYSYETATSAAVTFSVGEQQSLAITSTATAYFTVGVAGIFTVTTKGNPSSVTESGKLPKGLSFKTEGNGTATISGTTLTLGLHDVTITAANGITPEVSQALTIVVGFAPDFVTPSSATFVVGQCGTFVAATLGFPSATLTETGTLPTGLTFKTTGLGTATISGTPAPNTAGSYHVTITATNGFGESTQSLTIAVDQPPAFTSKQTATFTPKVFNTFTVETSGYPAASIAECGTLPKGVTFKTNRNGTATISGTPTTTKKTTYKLKLTATNGAGKASNQTFTLTVS